MNMAKRKYSKIAKIQPAVQKFFFDIETENMQDVHMIDLSQCASLMNRRFYRQGLNWAVAGFKLHTAAPGTVSINKLPNTWVLSNAWEKGFRAWQHMIKNATDDQGLQSIKGKFLDFKIYADVSHHGLGFGRNLLPHSSNRLSGFGSEVARVGQWQPAEIEIASTTAAPGTTTKYELLAVGPNSVGSGFSGHKAKSLIGGYEVSRALPYETDPNVPDDASSQIENWILGLYNEGNEQDQEVVEMLETAGDRAPYPFENDGTNTDTMYPGGQNNLSTLEVHSFDIVTTSTIGGQTLIPGGNFPCGLVQIITESFAAGTDMILEVDLVPGNHRGYLCEPMTEM